MSEAQHPSLLELDRLALGGEAPAATRRHLAGCPRCQAHMARIEPEPEVPGWVRRLPARSRRPWWAELRAVIAGGAVVAAAAALLLLVFTGDDRELPVDVRPATTTAKGGPEILVHIKRGDVVWRWDGRSPLQPADRFRLEVAPGGHRHIAVLTDGDSEQRVLLYQGPLAPQAGSLLLPTAWEVDDAPGPERLLIVLSDAPLDPVVRGADLDGAGTWHTTLTLPKQTSGDQP